MWKWRKNKHNKNSNDTNDNDNRYHTATEINIDTVKQAVREFAVHAPKGVTTRILVKDDHTIDYDLLNPYLKQFPDKPFYMSKETYEIFEEEDKHIPVYLDMIQQAVDRYVQMYKKIPITPGDPYRKVNYLLLEQNNLIHEVPTIELYITEDEYLITHKKPR